MFSVLTRQFNKIKGLIIQTGKFTLLKTSLLATDKDSITFLEIVKQSNTFVIIGLFYYFLTLHCNLQQKEFFCTL